MNTGYFYFLKDEYAERFHDCGVMPNKENDENGNHHGRPYYFAIQDTMNSQLLWMIPISSKIEKYKKIRAQKIEKYHIKDYDGVVFGSVLGNKRAFLIQNMCPVIMKYIGEQYINTTNSQPVTISFNTQKDIVRKARKLIELSKKGKQCTMTDIPKILKELSIDQNP